MIDTKSIVKDITIGTLENTKIGGYLKKASAAMEKAQEAAYYYTTDDSPQALKKMKIGTALAFAVVSKIADGKPIKQFTGADWKEIAGKVSEYAIVADGQQWSVIVFSAYADYVEISANTLEDWLKEKEKTKKEKNNKDTVDSEEPQNDEPEEEPFSKKKCDAIRALANQVRNLEEDLVNGVINEVDYTEKCLWLMLEAMIKLMAAYSAIFVGADASEFIQSISMLAFEYGRYTLYRQENEILELYLQHQKQLDAELQEKLDAYNAQLRDRENEFNALIKDAFVPDVMQRFRASVELARNAGVDESEILKTAEQVDEFFG